MSEDVLKEIEELQSIISNVSSRLASLVNSLHGDVVPSKDDEVARNIISSYIGKTLHKEDQKELFNKLRGCNKRNEKLSKILSRLNFTYKYVKLEGEEWASLLIE
jgi:hypothetical protein